MSTASSREAPLPLRWSPDGSQLALLVPSWLLHETVWLVPADGGAAHRLAGSTREDTTRHRVDGGWAVDPGGRR